MFDLTKIAANGWLQQIERDEMNTMVDQIIFLLWKLDPEQSKALGGDGWR